MQEDWLQREIRTFTSAVAGRIRRQGPSIEIPIAPIPISQDPPPEESKAGPGAERSRRTARRRRKRSRR